MKGYLTMGIVMLVQTCITLTKTVRDNHESSRLVNRIEDAKAERLLIGGVQGSLNERPLNERPLEREATRVMG